MAKKKKRRKQVIPKDETKQERFVRVVTPRVAKAVKAIKQVGHCAGASYESTPEQEEQISKALGTAVGIMLGKFEDKPEPQDVFEFTD